MLYCRNPFHLKRDDNKEDPFHLLPEELVIFIFNKVADLKCLCQCSLVSKHFSSVISQVRTVSLDISGSGADSQEYARRISKLAGELYCCSSEQIPSLLNSFSLKNLKLPNFLESLKELEFIHLNYKYPENSVKFPLPASLVKFSCNSIKLERFVAVVPRHIDNDREKESNDEQYTEDSNSGITKMVEFITQFRGRYKEWVCHIIILVKCHTSLQRVTITDSAFNAKLVVEDGQLASTGLRMLKEMVNLVSYRVSLAHVPVLRLPLSGYVCRWTVMLIVSAPEDPLVSSKKLDIIIDQDFEDKLMVLGEAVKEILRNHKHHLDLRQMGLFMKIRSMQ